MKECLTFDDVLLVPQFSDIVPSDVDLRTSMAGMEMDIPIFSAAMDTVTEARMMAAMAASGGVGVLHKNLTPSQQREEIDKAQEIYNIKSSKVSIIAIAVGVKDWEQRIIACEEVANLIVIDSAHGHSQNVMTAVKGIRSKFPSVKIMAGNVVTQEAVRALVESGADIIKCGIGPGSICTTRSVSGCGMPQFTAILECAEEADKYGIPVVADGGIKCSGDIVKALAAGAKAVMIGSMLAGTEESPGSIFTNNGKKFKRYRGMGSVGAMECGSKDRYGQAGIEKDKLVAEGVEAAVPYKGTIENTLHQLIGGLRSGMGYVGAKDILDLQIKAEFIKVTQAGIRENGVHDVKIGI